MSREIKFRAWVAHDYDDDDKPIDFKMVEWFPEFFSDMSPVTGWGSDFPKPDDDVFLMQFTGLQDKNGVEIYDRDILDYGSDEMAVVGYQARPGLAGFYIKGMRTQLCFGDPTVKAMVIGNIYENPDLIGEQNE